MNAFVFSRFHRLELLEYDIPEVSDGHALVQISHCGIDRRDADAYLGREPKVIPPRVLGNEICGRAVKVNAAEAPGGLEGSLVAVDPVIPCGICGACRAGAGNHCESLDIIGFTRDGGFAEFVSVPVSNVHVLPDTEDAECFTLSGALAAAFHVDRLMRIEEGGTCIILGSRPFDILCGLVLSRRKGIRVQIVDYNSFRLRIAQGLGLTCIDLQSSNCDSVLCDYFSENDGIVDVVVVGSSRLQNALYLGIGLVRARGQVVLTGHMCSEEALEPGELIEKEVVLSGANLHTREDFVRSIEDISEHADRYCSLITHRLPFSGTLDGLRIFWNISECMKVIVDNLL